MLDSYRRARDNLSTSQESDHKVHSCHHGAWRAEHPNQTVPLLRLLLQRVVAARALALQPPKRRSPGLMPVHVPRCRTRGAASRLVHFFPAAATPPAASLLRVCFAFGVHLDAACRTRTTLAWEGSCNPEKGSVHPSRLKTPTLLWEQPTIHSIEADQQVAQVLVQQTGRTRNDHGVDGCHVCRRYRWRGKHVQRLH